MDNNCFSANYSQISRIDIPETIRNEISRLEKKFQNSNVTLYKYRDVFGKDNIVAKLNIKIGLPSRGVFQNLDIKNYENILVFFDKNKYPEKAPSACVDRIDFPYSKLPHVNPGFGMEPPKLCLHRGDINEWFASKNIVDFVERVIGWLEDATKGHLIKDNDFFEPTRFDYASYIKGRALFPMHQFQSYVTKAWESKQLETYAYPICYLPNRYGNNSLISLFSSTILKKASIKDLEDEKKKRNPNNIYLKKDPFFGLITWAPSNFIVSEYFAKLPDAYNSFIQFTLKLGLSFEKQLNNLFELYKNDREITHIPVFICIQRPTKLIGSESELEIIPFSIENFNNSDNRSVVPLLHIEPLTTKLARKISANEVISNKKVILLGCGALGSKIGLHLARAGITDLTLIDKDTLDPHNLVRHALTSNYIGMNKSEALKIEIENTFREDNASLHVVNKDVDILEFINPKFDFNDWKNSYLIDSTASILVSNKLDRLKQTKLKGIFRTEIAFGGKLGLLLVEGEDRSPKLSDLKAALYTNALDYTILKDWLSFSHDSSVDDFKFQFEEIPIGLGCSSNTLPLADSIVSFHAAIQSEYIKKIIPEDFHKAGILLSLLESDAMQNSKIIFIDVPKFKEFQINKSDWRIRIDTSLLNKIIDATIREGPNETGGYLIGRQDKSLKTITITKIIDPPKDSEGYPYSFRLGVYDMPKILFDISHITGGQITYVGEWHSHPGGTRHLSETDLKAKDVLFPVLQKLDLKTLIMVATKEECYPYIW